MHLPRATHPRQARHSTHSLAFLRWPVRSLNARFPVRCAAHCSSFCKAFCDSKNKGQRSRSRQAIRRCADEQRSYCESTTMWRKRNERPRRLRVRSETLTYASKMREALSRGHKGGQSIYPTYIVAAAKSKNKPKKHTWSAVGRTCDVLLYQLQSRGGTTLVVPQRRKTKTDNRPSRRGWLVSISSGMLSSCAQRPGCGLLPALIAVDASAVSRGISIPARSSENSTLRGSGKLVAAGRDANGKQRKNKGEHLERGKTYFELRMVHA